MEPRRFGDYLAVEAFSQTSIGEVFKAVSISGKPGLYLLKVFSKEISECGPAVTLLQTHANKWKALGDLYTLGLNGFGQQDGRLFIAIEYQQGRLLSDVLARSAQEGLPLAHDQAVYLAERIAGALLSLSTQGQFHGALGAEEVLVTFEGEVKLLPGVAKDIQTTALLGTPSLQKFLSCQPPEVRSGQKAKESADRFALGALFFEFLAKQPLRLDGEKADLNAKLRELREGGGVSEPLPKNLASILEKSLIADAPGAYGSFDEMKADLNQLIASGEYSPSTFNMAFLMHSLFRDEDEPEAKRDREFLAMDRAKFLPAPPKETKAPGPEKAPEPPPKPKRKPLYTASPEPAPEVPAPTFGVEEEPSRKGLFISLGVLALIIVISVLAYLAFSRRGPAEAEIQARIDAQVAAEKAALKKQQDEMAAKLAASEQEKQNLEQQMANAKTADEKAKAQKLLEETRQRLDEQKKAQAQLAEKEKAVQAPPSGAAAQQPSAPAAPVQPSENSAPAQGGTAPAQPQQQPQAPGAGSAAASTTKAGDFVELFAVDVKPKELTKLSVEYTPQARANRLNGIIYLEVAIDETGAVTGAKVLRGPANDYGMGDALVKAAMKTRYSPAIKNGVPVKTSVTFPVRLEIK